MTPEAWSRLREVFAEVYECDPETRRRRLRERCGTDRHLEAEVARLVELHDSAGDFLETPAVRIFPDEETDAPRPEDAVGPYRLVREIARGGMGAVFLAERMDDLYEKRVAVKFLRRGDVTPALRDRFAHEMRALARVEHPFVARIIDGGTTESGWPFLIMEHVDGAAVTRFCERAGLGLRARLSLVRSICEAVQAVHAAGVVHGDVKPTNVLVTAGGEPRLVDFGLAVPSVPGGGTQAPRLQGHTPTYASPEQLAGRGPLTASDVYSLGVLLFELAAGRPPGNGETVTPRSVSDAIRRGPAGRSRRGAAIARALGFVVARATATAPADRYASAEEMARDVDRVLAGEPPRAWERHPLHRAVAFGVRYRRQVATVLALVAVAGVAYWFSTQRAEQRTELLRRYGNEAREIEYGSRLEAMLPRHDVRPFRQRLRRRVERLEGEIEEALWPAPVRYAAGVGRLELGEHAAAAEHLGTAWDSGLRAPEVGRALAEALSHLYRHALREADWAVGDAARRKRREAAAERYRPRLQALLDELGGGPGPAGAGAASSDGIGEAGLDRLSRRLLERPDDRNDGVAAILAGHAAMRRAMEAASRDLDRALGLAASAGRAYESGRAVWRSDLELHVADCSRAVTAVVWRSRRGDRAVALDDAVDACDRALEIDSENGGALAQRARLFGVAAQEDRLQGRNPETHVRLALESARRVEGDAALRASAYRSAGTALSNRGAWRFARGLDPRPDLERAEGYFERALGINPADAYSHYGIGGVWGWRAHDLARRGKETGAELERSIAALERALAVEGSPGIHLGAGIAYRYRAAQAAQRGEDASSWIERSVHHFDRALELTPGRAVYWERAAGIDLFQAYRASRDEGDPAPHLERALAKTRKALRLDPDCLDCKLTLAETLVLVAEIGGLGNETAAETLAEAERLLAPLTDIDRARSLRSRLRQVGGTVVD